MKHGGGRSPYLEPPGRRRDDRAALGARAPRGSGGPCEDGGAVGERPPSAAGAVEPAHALRTSSSPTGLPRPRRESSGDGASCGPCGRASGGRPRHRLDRRRGGGDARPRAGGPGPLARALGGLVARLYLRRPDARGGRRDPLSVASRVHRGAAQRSVLSPRIDEGSGPAVGQPRAHESLQPEVHVLPDGGRADGARRAASWTTRCSVARSTGPAPSSSRCCSSGASRSSTRGSSSWREKRRRGGSGRSSPRTARSSTTVASPGCCRPGSTASRSPWTATSAPTRPCGACRSRDPGGHLAAGPRAGRGGFAPLRRRLHGGGARDGGRGRGVPRAVRGRGRPCPDDPVADAGPAPHALSRAVARRARRAPGRSLHRLLRRPRRHPRGGRRAGGGACGRCGTVPGCARCGPRTSPATCPRSAPGAPSTRRTPRRRGSARRGPR